MDPGSLLSWGYPYRRRTAQFERRAALYRRCDAQLCEYTRFFAAASLVNTSFARFFALWPVASSRRSFKFLNDAGGALEAHNLVYASAIARRKPARSLDRALVCAEQAQLQRYLDAQRAQRPRQWQAAHRELNGLLNEPYAAAVVLRCSLRGTTLMGTLRDVRAALGEPLDFAVVAHRIAIGLRLIESIRAHNAIGTSPTAARLGGVPAASANHQGAPLTDLHRPAKVFDTN